MVAIEERPIQTFTEEEYLALEGVAKTKHEFVDGQILAMAGAELVHNDVCQNIRMILGQTLEDRPCRVVGSDQRVKVATRTAYVYPDVVVTCLEPELVGPKPTSLENPQVIFEVASPSTEDYDLAKKTLLYQAIPTLTDFVVVATSARFVVHYQRAEGDAWLMRKHEGDAVFTLSNGVEVPLDRVYRMVELGPQSPKT